MMVMREKLIELLFEGACLNTEQVEKWILGGKQGERPNAFQSQADHLIANDVVPVVRCKDCKFCELDRVARFKTVDGEEEHPVYVCFYHWRYNETVHKEHFCSYGERKDNG